MRVGEKEYYEKQIATLKSFEEVDAVVESDRIDEDDKEEQAQQERAMKISNYANIVLLILKVYISYLCIKFQVCSRQIHMFGFNKQLLYILTDFQKSDFVLIRLQLSIKFIDFCLVFSLKKQFLM